MFNRLFCTAQFDGDHIGSKDEPTDFVSQRRIPLIHNPEIVRHRLRYECLIREETPSPAKTLHKVFALL